MSRWQDSRAAEAARFVINGVVATGVQFGMLTFGIEVLHIPLAAIANLFASLFGITASFLGSRYFVFRNHTESAYVQASRFTGLYVAIACLHAAVLFIVTDRLGVDYRLGFVLATGLQVTLSYFGNRQLVFAK